MKAIANTTLRLGLVNLPVQVCAGSETVSDVTFNMGGPNGEPLSQAYIGLDGNVVPRDQIQKGIRDNEGNFHPVSKDDIEAISEATKMPDLNVTQVISRTTFAEQFERITGKYYLQSTKKGGNINSFRLLVDALWDNKQCLVTKWTARSRQKLMVIAPDTDGNLCAYSMAFASDMRAPDEMVRAHHAGQYSESEMKMAGQLLKAYAENGVNALDMEVDDAVTLRADLMTRTLAGEAIEIPETEEVQKTSSLMSALEASLEAVKK